MLELEQLYQLISNEQWTEILKVLYAQKVTIVNDSMLKQAALVFEQEFFKKLKTYPITDRAIEENLDSLYVLNYGKYYHLSDEHYKVLVQELVKRKKLPEAINYARYFPEDEICKQTILQFEELTAKESNSKPGLMTNASKNWIEMYNRLFELIDNQSDTATYFSGPRFINTVKEYEPYFPTYTQFIEQRNNEGKSTSRKIYYYDILVGLNDEIRLKVINRVLEILRPFQKEKVAAIDELLGHKVANAKAAIDAKVVQEAKDNPIVFISYSWTMKHIKPGS